MNASYKEILDQLGYKLTDLGDCWRTQALYRGGKTTTSVLIYKDSGVWKDFGIESEYLPFVQLVQKTLGDSNPDILKKILKNKDGFKARVERKKILLKEEKTYPEECLSRLLPHYDFYTNKSKNISVETLKKYECGLATSGKFYQRMVFPVRNKHKRIFGFSGRTLSNNQFKWIQVGRKSDWIYPYFNIEEVKEEIKNKKEVYIVESVGDSLSMFERGFKNNLVSFGLSFSPKLITFLSFLDVDRIFVSLNNSDAAQKAAVKNIAKSLGVIDIEKMFVKPPIKEDFGDMNTQEEFDKWRIHECDDLSVLAKQALQDKNSKKAQTELEKLVKIYE